MDLARHLRSWSAADLARLLETRPDLLPASDRGLDAVARKAGTTTSLGRVLVGADIGMLVVAEALVAIHPATVDEIDRLLGTDDAVAVVEAAERLRRRGVIVVDDGVLHPVGALPDLLHRPLGLGPSFVELADQLPTGRLERLAADTRAEGGRRSPTVRAVARRLRDPAVVGHLLAGAPPEVVGLFDQLTTSRSPAITLPAAYPYRDPTPGDPLGWLLDRGLVVPVNDRGAELPRELVIAAHPDGLAPGAALRPVELEPVPGLAADVVAADAADQANRALDGAETLLRLAGRREISVRRAGGVGPREIGRLGRVCGLDPSAVTRILELLVAARLIRPDGTSLTTTDLAGRWWSLGRRRRYLALVRAWVGADHFLSRGLPATGADDGPAGPVALGPSEPVAATAAARAVALETMADLEPGRAWEPDQLAAAVVWRAPNLWGPGDPPPERLVEWTVEEAALLGLTADHGPSPVLVALRSDDEAELDRAAAHAVADDQETVVLQADLTALALGPLAPSVARPLADMTDREAVGDDRAPTFRFTETSIRRALDAGWTAEAMVAFLTEHALAGIPQPLAYLIDDVARRHGSIRVLPAATVIVTDDDVGAVEIATNRRVTPLALRLVAPTVLTSPLDPVAVTEGLRAAGFLPVLHDDSVRVGHPGPATGDGDGGRPAGDLPADWIGPPLPPGPFPDEVADAVAALLEDGPPAERSEPGPVGTGAGGGGDPSLPGALIAAWGRPVRLRTDGMAGPVEVVGTVVGLGDIVSVLAATGVVEVPLTSLTSIDRLDGV
jgi:hypothetical protein